MKPYGASGQSPPHIKRDGAPSGWADTFKSFCKCCNGSFVKLKNKKHLKKLKSRARQQGKKQIYNSY